LTEIGTLEKPSARSRGPFAHRSIIPNNRRPPGPPRCYTDPSAR